MKSNLVGILKATLAGLAGTACIRRIIMRTCRNAMWEATNPEETTIT